METIECITTRGSIRKLLPDPVPEEIIKDIDQPLEIGARVEAVLSTLTCRLSQQKSH
jgi:hypothetical protein